MESEITHGMGSVDRKASRLNAGYWNALQIRLEIWYNSEMKFPGRLAAFSLLHFVIIGTAYAAPLIVDTGVTSTIPSIFNGFVDLLLTWSIFVASALFLLGCIMMVGSGGSDAILSNGKKIMKASLIGLAIILCSWLILSTAVFFIAGA